MTDPATQHNKAVRALLRAMCDHETNEAAQWIILESLCLGIGKLHGRTPRQTAIFIETMAERLVTGERV